jgi:hypothetical protein
MICLCGGMAASVLEDKYPSSQAEDEAAVEETHLRRVKRLKRRANDNDEDTIEN